MLSQEGPDVCGAFRPTNIEGELGPYNAQALYHCSPWIMTSSNRDHIPFIDLTPTNLRARADGRFGLEDYASVPQVYSEAYPWAPCIPRQPESAEVFDKHEYCVLWEDLQPVDFVSTGGSVFGEFGVLHPDVHSRLHRKLKEIEQRAIYGIQDGPFPQHVSFAASAMMVIVRRLRELPMTYRDLVLQWTQAQRLGLDLLGMHAYYGWMSQRMMQRHRVWPLSSDFIGCFTQNPTTAENMHYAGIPFVFMRLDSTLTPGMLHVRAVVHSFAKRPWHVVTADWPTQPCRNLHIGSSSTSRIMMSRPLGRYFEDLPPLPSVKEDVADMALFLSQSPPSPSTALPKNFAGVTEDEMMARRAPQPHGSQQKPRPSASRATMLHGRVQKQHVQPGSRTARRNIQKSLQAQVNSRPRAKPSPAPQPANRDKWAPLIHDLMPPPSTQWSAARQRVNRNATLQTDVSKDHAGLMYPDPAYFVACDPRVRSTAIAAWLSIRASRCGQMAYPEHQQMPVVSATTWRQFFRIWKDRPAAPSSMSVTDTVHDEATAAAKRMFGEDMIALVKDTSREVFWNSKPIAVVDGVALNLEPLIIRQIHWELLELNWRYELMALDKVAAPHQWAAEDIANKRVDTILRVFSPFPSFILTDGPFPTEQPSASAASIIDRLPALKALRCVMVDWKGCTSLIKIAQVHEMPTTECPEAALLEEHTMNFYCQTFFEYFHRPPILPALLPI